MRLRGWRRTDDERVRQACTDPVTRHWLGGSLPAPYTVHEARGYLRGRAAALHEGAELSWCVADPETDECLGAVSVMHLLEADGTGGEIGYWTHPQARGRGVTTEAVRLAVRHAFVPHADGGWTATPAAQRRRRQRRLAAGGAALRLRRGRARPVGRAAGRRLVRRPGPLRPARGRVRRGPRRRGTHPFGDGEAGERGDETQAAGRHPGTRSSRRWTRRPSRRSSPRRRRRPCGRRTPSRRRRRTVSSPKCGAAQRHRGRDGRHPVEAVEDDEHEQRAAGSLGPSSHGTTAATARGTQ